MKTYKTGPCVGCTTETGRCANPNCHETCEKYLEFFHKNEERKARIQEEKAKEREMDGYIVSQRIRDKKCYQRRF